MAHPLKAANPMLVVFTPAMAWMNVWLKFNETMWASSQVIAHRTDLMSKAGPLPTAEDQRELSRMVSEKVEAFGDASRHAAMGLAAIGPALPLGVGMNLLKASNAAGSLASSKTWTQAVSRQVALWQQLARSSPAATELSHQIAQISSKALAPVHAKATANAKRLNAKRVKRLLK